MSEDTLVETEEEETFQVDELGMLKRKADLMGIRYSNNIGAASLRERINERLESEERGEIRIEVRSEPNALTEEPIQEAKPAKVESLRTRLHRENMRLVRVRITNMNPKKANLPGEFLTVANKFLGTVKKYVPYGEESDNGYHVPYCLYKMMRDRKFLQIRTIKDRRTNTNRIESSWVREFALDILPPLTAQELKDLALAQAAAGSID